MTIAHTSDETRANRPVASGNRAGTCLASGLLLLLSACASNHPALVLDPVGPAASIYGIGSEGRLQVFSETEPHNSDRIIYYLHSGYSVYSPEGKRVKSVTNHVGDLDEVPTVLTLPAGRYTVIAHAEGYGRISVPVVIARGETTRVYLERRGMPGIADVAEKDLVRLPRGAVVGWRAHELPGGVQERK